MISKSNTLKFYVLAFVFILGYFGFGYMMNVVWKADVVLFGVFWELLTIPMLLASTVFPIACIYQAVKVTRLKAGGQAYFYLLAFLSSLFMGYLYSTF